MYRLVFNSKAITGSSASLRRKISYMYVMWINPLGIIRLGDQSGPSVKTITDLVLLYLGTHLSKGLNMSQVKVIALYVKKKEKEKRIQLDTSFHPSDGRSASFVKQHELKSMKMQQNSKYSEGHFWCAHFHNTHNKHLTENLLNDEPTSFQNWKRCHRGYILHLVQPYYFICCLFKR